MMKRLLTIACIACSFAAVAQPQLNNSGFETWTGGYPVSWDSPDKAVSDLGLGNTGTVVQGTPPYAGSFAVELSPKNNVLLGQTIPGIVVSGDFDVNFTTFEIALKGTPYTHRPTDLTFYYKFAPTGGDTAGALVLLTKWNSTLNIRDTMAYGELQVTTAAASYTLGTVTLNYHNTATPDSIIVAFAGTLNQMTIGTVFTVDEVSINGTASDIDENAKDNGLMVYPNPATDVLNFNVARSADLAYVEVYDINGQRLNTISVAFGTLSSMDVSALASGLYVYAAFNSRGERVYTGKFDVKH